MFLRKSLTSKKIKSQSFNDCISESKYISNIISSNIEPNFKLIPFSVEKLFFSLSPKNIKNIFLKMIYICESKTKIKITEKENDKYLSIFLYLVLFLLESDDIRLDNKKNILLKNYIFLIEKYYKQELLTNQNISILIKFIAFSSIYDRREITIDTLQYLFNLMNSQIRIYQRIQYAIEILKTLNIAIFNVGFCEFLSGDFLKHKSNKLLLTEKNDLLQLLYLNDKNDYIIDFLSNLFSFRYSKSFIELFIDKIKHLYEQLKESNNDINDFNNNINDLFTNFNKSILLIQKINTNEDIKYKEDPYFLQKGFLFNDSRLNGIFVKKIVVQTSLTVVFSFCFSPEKKKSIEKTGSHKSLNLRPISLVYPIINFVTDNNSTDGFSFYIKGNSLFHRIFNENKEVEIIDIKENQTYVCIYSAKEFDNYSISIKSDINYNDIKPLKKFLKRNLTLQIGRANKMNFEGYIGPVLIFKEYIDDEYKNYIFSLKGSYDRILYYNKCTSIEADQYDKLVNHLSNDNTICKINIENNQDNEKDEKNKKKKKEKEKNKTKSNTNVINYNDLQISAKDYYSQMVKFLQDNSYLDNNLLAYITPSLNSVLNKTNFTNNIFIETIINYYIEPRCENGATTFFENNSTMFEFLKYEGFNYLIMVINLLVTNYKYIKNEQQEKMVISIFNNIINYITELLNSIKIQNFLIDIRNFLFSIKQFTIKYSKNQNIGEEIILILNNLIRNIGYYINDNIFSNDKKKYLCLIRNEISKFLLDVDLYIFNNYLIIECFMNNLYEIVNNIPYDLINLNIFKKLINFSVKFKKINDNNILIKQDPKFKSAKAQYNKILVHFLTKSESKDLYSELYKLFSQDFKYNYLKFLYIKNFYLCSKFYFDNIDDEILIKSWKYFVDLFEYFEKNEFCNDSNNNITEKEGQIIMSICLRIILENFMYKDFFKSYINSNKNEQFELLILLKTKEEQIKNMINNNLIFELKSSGYWTELADYDQSTLISKRKFSTNKKYNKYIRPKSLDKSNNKKRCKLSIDDNDIIENNKNNLLRRCLSKGNIDKNKKNNNNINNTNNLTITINSTTANTDGNILKPKNKPTNKYRDYYSYKSLLNKISQSRNLNDYCFKSLLLFVLEKNNKVNIPQHIKLKFILKVKKIEHLSDPDYKSFLQVGYYNKEIKSQFHQLIKIIDMNKNKLSAICYHILFYLIIQIAKERQQNRNVFKIFIQSPTICTRLFKLAFLNNKESTDEIIKQFPLLIKLIIPYHKKNFIPYLLYYTMLDPKLLNYSQLIMNLILNYQIDFDISNKLFYDYAINKLIILYYVIRSPKIVINDNFNIDEKGIYDLVNENLMFTKYDIMNSSSKKCYIQILYDVILYICIKTKNQKYFNIANKLFIEVPEKFIRKNKTYNTIIYYIDKNNIKEDKKNPCNKLFARANRIDEECLCISFLQRTLRYWAKYHKESMELNNMLSKYSILFFNDAKLIFKESKAFQKKTKNNMWYDYMIDNIHKIVLDKKEIKFDDIQKMILEKYQDNKTKKKKATPGEKIEEVVLSI